ncbi:LysE family translocator [Serratia odorifera]|jgi:threonine/homoserine/homoserine lactone efflux protein|uniref:Translocator protein, LysE family n=2 Tax=Serratia odorifera TaxID=618 RepID=D4E920_SEROD|nr:LysE family translocator [Serratia odorifera]EFE93786.1 translocator protein, LysE family [Serratia odorifera DSM 4582]MBJ2064134.1 LysE family translocator [Serratia odorifera]PNK88605.1 LysE family translocator [Serratia odorifera]RII69600.1 LysE family translocator [Serratia odorifera]VDZ65407.1 Homoserine/homoserine lactone efflux protein [Serratia odorifera]
MDIATLLLFSAACLALAVTPGPDMLLIASRSLSQGRRAGFASLAGIQLGTYCHALAAALGLSQLFVAVPLAYDAVRLLGAAYLLYLAWKTLRTGSNLQATAGLQTVAVGRILQQGLWTNILNPKMALFVLALFPQFINPQAGSVVVQMLLLATVLNVIGLAINGGVILLIGGMKSRFAGRQFSARWPNYLLSGVFAGLACKLIFDSRK